MSDWWGFEPSWRMFPMIGKGFGPGGSLDERRRRPKLELRRWKHEKVMHNSRIKDVNSIIILNDLPTLRKYSIN